MAENFGYDLSAFEVSRINSEALASFLEESSLMEDIADDERLTSVMQSLEAEISAAAAAAGGDDFTSLPEMKSEELHGSMEEEFQPYDLNASEGYSTSSDLEFDYWTTDDAEMTCCSPSDEVNSMLLEYSADEIEDAVVMFVGINEHHTQFWDNNGVFLEEHGYSSLWQEPYYGSL